MLVCDFLSNADMLSLIVRSAVFFTISVALDFVLYMVDDFSDTQVFGITAMAKIFEYGGFLCGLLSIILPKMFKRK